MSGDGRLLCHLAGLSEAITLVLVFEFLFGKGK